MFQTYEMYNVFAVGLHMQIKFAYPNHNQRIFYNYFKIPENQYCL